MSLDFKNKRDTNSTSAKDSGSATAATKLLKLKKRELLEIMLKQGEEIDNLRARVAELEDEVAAKEAELEKHEFEIEKLGSIAEASLQVTDIFQEAEKAAKIYLENLRRRYE